MSKERSVKLEITLKLTEKDIAKIDANMRKALEESSFFETVSPDSVLIAELEIESVENKK